MTQLRVGDVVRPRSAETVKYSYLCPCGKYHYCRYDYKALVEFGPAIVTAFSNVPGNVYVRRPFEHRMVYVFSVEDLEVVESCSSRET